MRRVAGMKENILKKSCVSNYINGTHLKITKARIYTTAMCSLLRYLSSWKKSFWILIRPITLMGIDFQCIYWVKRSIIEMYRVTQGKTVLSGNSMLLSQFKLVDLIDMMYIKRNTYQWKIWFQYMNFSFMAS